MPSFLYSVAVCENVGLISVSESICLVVQNRWNDT